MTQDIPYDSLFPRYEAAKHLLHEITTTFTRSFDNVQSLIQQHGTNVNGEFINNLTSILSQSKSDLEILFKETNDPGLFEPTGMEQQIEAFKSEKQVGMELVKDLRNKIESLEEEKSNWTIRENKGKKMIEQYQREINELKNNNNNNNNNTSYDDNNNNKLLNGTETDSINNET
eukprot:194358_1